MRLEFPIFPDPAGKVAEDGQGNVIMPTEYWLEIAHYALEVEKVRELDTLR